VTTASSKASLDCTIRLPALICYPDCGLVALQPEILTRRNAALQKTRTDPFASRKEGWSMAPSHRVSCLARIEPAGVELLTASLASIAYVLPVVLARIAVTELGLLAPNILVADLDVLDVDPLEDLRMLRFVLPNCMIAVYTGVLDEKWAAACHMAGANCLLSKLSDAAQLADGLSSALRTGCFTDPGFEVA
jgi:hypothetical protein